MDRTGARDQFIGFAVVSLGDQVGVLIQTEETIGTEVRRDERLPLHLIERAARVRLLLMDCDGVLTDGRLYFTSNGEEMKVFNVRDGQGLVMWHEAGAKSGIISGRGGRDIIQKRAVELGIKYTHTGSKNKVDDMLEIAREASVDPSEVAFVGDDIGDIDLMNHVGFPVAVGDAVDEAKNAAVYVTRASGGHGAVREVVDLLLAARRRVD